MNSYELLGESIGNQKDADGHPYRIHKNGVKIFGADFAACINRLLAVANDADLFVSYGQSQTVGDYRRKRIASARAGGLKIDENGVIG